MTTEFKIRRGPASDLFDDITVGALERRINPNLRIEVGCWYITSDTAELFLGIALQDGSKTLKRINSDSMLAAIADLRLDLERFITDNTYKPGSGLCLDNNKLTVDTAVIATVAAVESTATELRNYVNNQIITGGSGVLDCGEI